MIKKIIHKPRKPLFVFKKEDLSLYGPRIKSAPPIEINFDLPVKSESKPIIRFTKADGTPLMTEDLVESADSDSSNSTKSEDSEEDVSNAETSEDESEESHLSSEKNELESKKVEISSEESEYSAESTDEVEEDFDPKDRASMLSNLLKKFSDQKAPSPSRRLCYSVDEIFRVEDRTKIPLDLKIKKKKDETKGSYRTDRNRKDTCIEQARLEFNRLAAKNLNLVIKNLKNVKVETIAEMKEIAKTLFNKTISEPTFVKHYALLVLDLKREWQSEEEKTKDVNQTVFFGTLLTLTLKTLENKEKWGDEQEKKGDMTFEERVIYEEELEEAETERYVKKRRTLGTIDFLSALYSLNVISYVHINACIEALMASEDQENVEVLCYLIESIGEKLVVSGKDHVISAVCSNLGPKKNKYANRIKYMIEGLLEKRSTWKPREGKAENMFSCLEVENDHESLQSQEKGLEERESALTFLSSLFEELSVAYEDEDKGLLADNFAAGEAKFGIVPFYSAYFQEAISNYRVSDMFFDFFISFRTTTKITEEQLKEVLSTLKTDLDILRIDFPISPKKYAELITKLRVAGIISPALFDSLKASDYDTKAVDLISKWYRSEKDREKALLIFSSEKIENLIKK